LARWGTTYPQHTVGSFSNPRGGTVDNKFVYICDFNNHRVQLLRKDGVYESQWGGKGIKDIEFTHPRCIYNDKVDDIFYISDKCTIQLFQKDGICIQRLGTPHSQGKDLNQFTWMNGCCVLDDRLYVCDRG